jgi:hypothetical protein
MYAMTGLGTKMLGRLAVECRFDLKEGVNSPPVTTSNGAPLYLYQNTNMTNPSNDPSLGESRTYRGHLDSQKYDPAISPRHQLALFHYVTRSLEDYTTRKIKLPSGIYTYNYVQYGKQARQNLGDASVLARFEHENGFDGTSPVCNSAAERGYAERCCRSE